MRAYSQYVVGFIIGAVFILSVWSVTSVVSHIAAMDNEIVKIETFLSHVAN
jgi:hypothetical protein